VRQPRPPIWIGGSSPAAIRRTAAFGDGWLPQGTRRRDLPGQIARLRELRAELRGGAPIDIGTIVEPIHLRLDPTGPELPNYVLTGGADEIASSLRELVDMGVNHLQVRFVANSVEEFCEQTLAFGDQVGPLLQS
jgi:alkanesulfonate monooxygenase SsuD/methylene tetrahydromethanopterin reductase-like flavin-dependent oxidoreductase (luciferase family)